MGQWFSQASCFVRGGHVTPMVVLVAVRVVTSVREQPSRSHSTRMSHRGDIPSTSDGGNQDIGLDEDSARRELKGRRQDVAMFLRGEAIMVVDKDPEEVVEEDPEEEAMGFEDYVPFSYSLEPVDPKDFDPWDNPASDYGFGVSTSFVVCIYMLRSTRNIHFEPESSWGDAIGRLLEAIELLVAQNAQQQRLQQ
ncbi:hypothetical protein FNV43_RR05817 [Rhamnella rubrinervis]|uniref:Uncharacterized protein n=1 Tax=Rhamnella rubrinervis TaxID=2594499 RepID=A0A8K0HMS3_9ROSA|nr:hypothetical protein FNV43_RR05817 [Rhamnella rubrinervis]